MRSAGRCTVERPLHHRPVEASGPKRDPELRGRGAAAGTRRRPGDQKARAQSRRSGDSHALVCRQENGPNSGGSSFQRDAQIGRTRRPHFRSRDLRRSRQESPIPRAGSGPIDFGKGLRDRSRSIRELRAPQGRSARGSSVQRQRTGLNGRLTERRAPPSQGGVDGSNPSEGLPKMAAILRR